MAAALDLLKAVVSVVPAGVVFFTAYGRYDGQFRDQTVFLHFIGGLILGGLLGFATLALYATNAPLPQVILPALLYPIAITSVQNRRKWQGERHAVFNGGAMGLGVAVMMAFSFTYVLVKTFDPNALGQAALLAASLALLLFGLGLLAGDGVRAKQPFRRAFLGTAILLAPAIFLEEYFRSLAWFWLLLLFASGAVFAYAANQKLLPLGLSDEARRGLRRKRRAAGD